MVKQNVCLREDFKVKERQYETILGALCRQTPNKQGVVGCGLYGVFEVWDDLKDESILENKIENERKAITQWYEVSCYGNLEIYLVDTIEGCGVWEARGINDGKFYCIVVKHLPQYITVWEGIE